MIKNRVCRCTAFSMLACIFAFSGCSNGQLPTYKVSGQLEFDDGTVPKFGTIELFSQEHKLNARGKIQKDGSFTLTTYEEDDGAVAGEHKVAIIQLTGDPLLAKTELKIEHDHGNLVHRKYFDYRTSGLTLQVNKELNEVKLLLEKAPNTE